MIEYILAGICILTIIIAHIERKDLYDRIMSKNIIEYKDTRKEEPNQIEDQPDTTIPLDDAEDLIREDLNG